MLDRTKAKLAVGEMQCTYCGKLLPKHIKQYIRVRPFCMESDVGALHGSVPRRKALVQVIQKHRRVVVDDSLVIQQYRPKKQCA
jgi:hypothetical protein